jgi:cyclopropane-fatty-acyl-phospholipid synthase
MPTVSVHPARLIEDLLASAGIQINGHRRYDIQVKSDRFFQSVLRRWSLGLGEAYMEGPGCEGLAAEPAAW